MNIKVSVSKNGNNYEVTFKQADKQKFQNTLKLNQKNKIPRYLIIK